MSLWSLSNILSYSLQLAVVVLSGWVVSALLRIRSPRLLLAHDYALLAVGSLLPLLAMAAPRDIGVLPVVARFSADAEGAAASFGRAFDARLLGALWLAGVLVQLGLLAAGMVRLRSLARHGRVLTARPAAIDEIEQRLGTSATWMVSDAVKGPATFGVVAPIVLVPAAVLEGDPAVLRMAACHELEHVRRRDWLAVVAEELTRALLWFHPCVWFLLSRIRVHREQVVDERVVATLGRRDDYARALVEGAAREIALQTGIAPAWLQTRQLRARVIAIRRGETMSTSRMAMAALVSVGAIVASGYWTATAFPLQAAMVQSDGSKVYGTSEGVTLPKLVERVKPDYTPEAMKEKIQGELRLDVIVKADGTVGDVTITQSLDARYGLDQKGVDAARRWRFEPGTKDGKPVNVRVSITLRFTLK